MKRRFYIIFIKPAIDFVLALTIFIVLLPVFILSILLIDLTSKGSFYFSQDRLGKDGKVFRLYKLRTMTNKNHIPDREIFASDPELTKVGKWLRRFKIDELPQLINIMKGDMAIVGPRPCLVSQLNDLDQNGIRRLEVKPGLTGLAQINGNINLTWEERWEYDRQYVETLSLKQDIRIILKTTLIIIFGEEKFTKLPNV
jgi:undecaprenyl phosphate N,N'-diacetylbacillosamine 1-phosphate transferase